VELYLCAPYVHSLREQGQLYRSPLPLGPMLSSVTIGRDGAASSQIVGQAMIIAYATSCRLSICDAVNTLVQASRPSPLQLSA
jgi:hypothetical protein